MQALALLFAFVVSTFAERRVYAHVWAAGTSNDFPDALITLDYTQNSGSARFGKVVSTAPLVAGTGRKLFGNAPHHIGISGDEQWVVGGGLLSFFVTVPIGDINGGNKHDTFLFHLNSEMIPSFHSSYDLPGGCTDEFHQDTPTSWIVSQMCDDSGNSPGGLYRFVVPSCSTKNSAGLPSCYASWTNWISGKTTTGRTSVLTGFNPHGGDWSDLYGFIISDFVWPASLLNTYTKGYLATIGDNVDPLTFRGTVNYFDTRGNLKRTFNLPTAAFSYTGALGTINAQVNIGMMQTKFFPGTLGRYAFTSGVFLNYNLFLIDLTTGDIEPVFDFAANYPGLVLSVGIPKINPLKNAIIQTVGMRHLALIGYSWTAGKPTNFVKRAGVDFGSVSDGATPQFPTAGYPGSHYIAIDQGLFENPRVFVVNSFVDFPVNPGYNCGDLLSCPADQAPGFMYNFHGARTVASVNLNNDWTTLTLDTTFSPNLGGRTPHSVAISDKWVLF